MAQNKAIIIFGTGMAASMTRAMFEQEMGRRVIGFTVDSGHKEAETYEDLPLIAFEDLGQTYPPDQTDLFIAVGYSQMNRVRAAKMAAAKELGYALPACVSQFAQISPNVAVPANAMIAAGSVVQPFVALGEGVWLYGGLVGHHSVLEAYVVAAGSSSIGGQCRIGEGAFIGLGAAVRDHVTIGRRALVGAGVVVQQNVAEEAVLKAPAPVLLPKRSSELSV